MDLNTMEEKVANMKYKCLEEFLADTQTVLHNVFLTYGGMYVLQSWPSHRLSYTMCFSPTEVCMSCSHGPRTDCPTQCVSHLQRYVCPAVMALAQTVLHNVFLTYGGMYVLQSWPSYRLSYTMCFSPTEVCMSCSHGPRTDCPTQCVSHLRRYVCPAVMALIQTVLHNVFLTYRGMYVLQSWPSHRLSYTMCFSPTEVCMSCSHGPHTDCPTQCVSHLQRYVCPAVMALIQTVLHNVFLTYGGMYVLQSWPSHTLSYTMCFSPTEVCMSCSHGPHTDCPTQCVSHLRRYVCPAVMALIHTLLHMLLHGIVLFTDALRTFYLLSCGIGHMVKDCSDNDKVNCSCHFMGYSF